MTIKRYYGKLASKARAADEKVNYYFANERPNITEKNLSTLKVVSVSTVAVALVLSIVAPALIEGWAPTSDYFRMIPTLTFFIIFSFSYGTKEKKNFYVVQGACLLYYIMMLYHLIRLSVFSYPAYPETYISCFFILMSVLFIFRPHIILFLFTGVSIIFSELVLEYKVGVAVSHDRFAIIASFIFSLVTMIIVLKLRLNDFYLREKYMTRSRTDLLTGLLNKCSYEEFCELALDEKRRNTSCALFVFDVDDFKTTNDTYGHMIGDRALEIIGDVLSEAFRSDDLVGRIGGDEFSAMILPVTDERVLEERALYVRTKVNERALDELGITITMSVGIAVRNGGGATYDQLFKVADGLLYNAKDSEIERVLTQMI